MVNNQALPQRPLADTAAGRVEGTWENGVATFLAIPYAAPPVGDLRFAAPRPPEPWAGARPADTPGQAPVQENASRADAILPKQLLGGIGEDALTLNVWTPSPDRDSKLPVMVWIHGGGYQIGAGSAPVYSGHTLSRRGDVVTVTINYRLGSLGYLYLPQEIPEANFGLQDQFAALRWVRENIESFGGDLDNVTVFGQSAGAHSIASVAAADGGADLFRRAILQSLPVLLADFTAEVALERSRLFLDCLGMPGAGLAELRALPAQEFLRAQRAMAQREPVGQLFAPVIDGQILRREPVAAMRAGSFDQAQVMVGFTKDEGLFFVHGRDDLWNVTRQQFADQSDPGTPSKAGTDLLDLSDRPDSAPMALVVADVVGSQFGTGVSRFAEARALAGQPVNVFEFRRQAGDEQIGACHCAELPFVFNNLAEFDGSPLLADATDQQNVDLANAVQDSWLAFAKTGDPSHSGLPDWPAFELDGRAVLGLDVPAELRRLQPTGESTPKEGNR
ncbi:carboxylesterase/lipase family protein [Streptomyces chartreusis]|uniref:carboxylesterase/lipase family protein n=1 Tax=Streptomyces chartreusis TaxID=1969 RepID=UPI00362A2D3B